MALLSGVFSQERERKASARERLITEMLDRAYPIPGNPTEEERRKNNETRDRLRRERRLDDMSIEELQRLAAM